MVIFLGWKVRPDGAAASVHNPLATIFYKSTFHARRWMCFRIKYLHCQCAHAVVADVKNTDASGIGRVVASFLALGLATSSLATPPLDDTARMRLAAAHLVQSQLPSGLLPYDFDFASGAAADMNNISGPNIVRQADALYALVQYLEVADSSPPRKTVEKMLRAFAQRSLPVGKGDVQLVLERLGAYNRWQLWQALREPLNAAGLLYVTHGPGALVSANGSYERAWPGATALALVSELLYRDRTRDEQFAPMRERWLQGLLALHVQGRGLREAPHYLSESPYVNGEAWLALAEYARAFPADKRISADLSELDEYLLARYSATPSVQFYHWGAMAAAQRAKTTGEPRFARFVRDQTRWLLEQRNGDGEPAGHNSCHSVEGLATAYRLLSSERPAQDPLLARIREKVERAMVHNRSLQLREGQIDLRLDDGTTVHSPEIARHAGAFLTSSALATIRIDWTAHCLSALVRMQEAGLAR